jgi:hypothetical protein
MEFIPLQKLPEFVLKRPGPVMRFLIVDVLHESAQLRLSKGEDTVTALPCESSEVFSLIAEPVVRSRFQVLDQVALRYCAGKSQGQMHIVRDATDTVSLATHVASYRRKVRVKVRSHGWVNPRFTMLRAKDDVDNDETQRLCHARIMSKARSETQPLTTETATGFVRVIPSSTSASAE